MANEEIAKVKPSNVQVLKSILNANSVQDQFNNALKDNSGPFVASVIDLYTGDDYLQKCDPKLVVAEALKAAILKLPINKSLGFAYVVPFKNVPTFTIGYKGFIQLAMRTGQYKYLNADRVFEGELKRRDKLTGLIDFDGEKTSDKVIGYFAHFELLNGFTKTLYMTKDEVESWAKKYSPSYNSPRGLWKTDFDTMALKTPLKRLLSHYGYLSIEMISAFDKDFTPVNPQDEIRNNSNREVVDIDSVEVKEEVVAKEDVKVPTSATGDQFKANFDKE